MIISFFIFLVQENSKKKNLLVCYLIPLSNFENGTSVRNGSPHLAAALVSDLIFDRKQFSFKKRNKVTKPYLLSKKYMHLFIFY